MKVFNRYFQKAIDKNWITNRGELVKELEEKLKNYLGVSQLTLTTNGTLPIQIAIKALELRGEIITTPFSYVATTSSIVWEGCTPVFVDIDPLHFTIDPELIEDSITDKTSAILATHVYGNPCDVDAIDQIAKRNNLKVIYDSAHCFGVNYMGKSIFTYGDVSTCSFHATKIFHTGEGGCFVSSDEQLHQKMFYHHNFGHDGTEAFFGLGINAKMSELQAAMGLAVFDEIPQILERRRNAVEIYDKLLESTDLGRFHVREGTDWNYHYYPVLFSSEELLLKAMKHLKLNGNHPRRYYYPSLNTLPYVNYKEMPISESISKRVLCLPLSSYLKEDQIKAITDIICEIL